MPKTKTLKNILTESMFFRSFRLAKSSMAKTSLMVLFDVSFFLSFYYVLPLIASYSVQGIAVLQGSSFLAAYLVFSIVYTMLVIFAYSFFKYCVLDFVSSMLEKRLFSFRRLFAFFLLNIVLYLPVFLAFSFILDSIREAYRPYFFFAVGVPFGILLYLIVNISNSIFYHGASIRRSLKGSFRIIFSGFKSCSGTILPIIIAAVILALFLWVAGSAVSLLFAGNYFLYLRAYSYFTSAGIVLTSAVFYLVLLVNRISFYSIAMDKNSK